MMAAKGKTRHIKAVEEIEKAVELLDKCLEVSRREKLDQAARHVALAQLELRKGASRLLERQAYSRLHYAESS